MIKEEIIRKLEENKSTYPCPYLSVCFDKDRLSEKTKKEYDESKDKYKGMTLREYINIMSKETKFHVFKHEIQLCEPYDVSKYKYHVDVLFSYHGKYIVIDDDFNKIGDELSENDERFNSPIFESYLNE